MPAGKAPLGCASRAAFTHLCPVFAVAGAPRDDSSSGHGSTCVSSLDGTKNSLCALLYTHTTPGQGRGSLTSPTQLSSGRQKVSFTFQDRLHMTQSLESVSSQANVLSGLRSCPDTDTYFATFATFSYVFGPLVHMQMCCDLCLYKGRFFVFCFFLAALQKHVSEATVAGEWFMSLG